MDDSNNVFGQKPNNYSPEINVPPVSTPQPPVTVPQVPISPQPVVDQPVIAPQIPVEQPAVTPHPVSEPIVIHHQEPSVPTPVVESPVNENNFSIMQTIKKKKKFPFLVLLVILLLLGVGYFFGKKYLFIEKGPLESNEKTENDGGNGLVVVDQNGNAPKDEGKKVANLCESEQKEILDLIKKFEEAQKEQNATAALALFTEPEVKEERDELAGLDGSDSNLPPRLYNNVSTNYRTEGYVVVGNPALVEGTLNCYVLVEESRAYYGGPSEPGYNSPLPKNFSIEVQKIGEKWLIESYKSTEENVKKTKYAGFIMEITQ